jgi:hypothetical protein
MEPVHFLLALAIGALLLVGISKAVAHSEEVFRRNGTQVQGQVIKNQFCLGENSVFRPVVQFTTAEGAQITALDEHGMALAVPRFSVGQKVLLVYAKDNPQNFRIQTSGRFA